MHGNWSMVQKLILRELTGSLTQRYSSTRKSQMYEKCPEHLQISLKDIISQQNLLLGHVVTGFTRDGKYIMSYQCRIIDEIEDGCPFLGYRYSLHWWEFHYKMPSKKAHVVKLFVDEDIYNELHLLICQPPSGMHIIVHGNSSNLRSSMMYSPPSKSLQSSTCYLTVAPAPLQPTEKSAGVKTRRKNTLEHSYTLHFKYELVPPHPPFFPSVNLKFDDTMLINSGDFLCALSAYVNIDDCTSDGESDHFFSHLNRRSNCFCGFLSRCKDLSCPKSDTASTQTPGDSDTSILVEESKPVGDECFCPVTMTNAGILQDGNAEPSEHSLISTQLRKADSETGAHSRTSLSKHTSCYLCFYGNEPVNARSHSNSPFDCTSTTFPVTIAGEDGKVVPQTASHRCFSEDSHKEADLCKASGDVVVKQVIFDAENFLDEKLRSLDCTKGNFFSLKDYDMQLVQACTGSRDVIVLIRVLIRINETSSGSNASSAQMTTYNTGFLLTWNIQTGVVSVLEEYPVVKFEKQKCKSRSACHGLEQAVDLRKKVFHPTNLNKSVLSFSNHTVFTGRSMKYILHPFQPLAMVM